MRPHLFQLYADRLRTLLAWNRQSPCCYSFAQMFPATVPRQPVDLLPYVFETCNAITCLTVRWGCGAAGRDASKSPSIETLLTMHTVVPYGIQTAKIVPA